MSWRRAACSPSAAPNADALLRMQRDAGAEVSAPACRSDATIDAAPTSTRRALTMLDADTGADRAVVVDWQSALELKPLKARQRPCGYWLHAGAADAVERLRQLGVEVHRFAEPAQLRTERWHETVRSEGARADVRGTIADGAAQVLHVEVELAAEAFRRRRAATTCRSTSRSRILRSRRSSRTRRAATSPTASSARSSRRRGSWCGRRLGSTPRLARRRAARSLRGRVLSSAAAVVHTVPAPCVSSCRIAASSRLPADSPASRRNENALGCA